MPRKLKRSTETWKNLIEALVIESLARTRLEYLAQKARLEGDVEPGRALAEAAGSHARGGLELLELLKDVGDPFVDTLLGSTKQTIDAAIRADTHRGVLRYPGFARMARDEGYDEVAEWFEVLARLERSRTSELKRMMEKLAGP